MTTPSYDERQITFALSLISNLSWKKFSSVGQMEAELARTIEGLFSNNSFVELVGPWKLVWGPAIYQAELSLAADNTIYVAQSETTPSEFVVSIAGTNPYSLHGIFVEDLDVSTTEPWPGVPDACLSTGTHKGLHALLATPTRKGVGTGVVTDFLQGQQAGKITTTGHSLGGTLAPVMAVWLKQELSRGNGGAPIMRALPFAGATPGNDTFANYGDKLLGAAQIERVWNRLDVVPHAWNDALLNAVPQLYCPEIEPNWLVNGLVAWASSISKNTRYTHLSADAPALPGEYVPTQPTGEVISDFLAQMNVQHVDEYFRLLGVSDLQKILQPYLGQLRTAAISTQDIVELLSDRGVTAE